MLHRIFCIFPSIHVCGNTDFHYMLSDLKRLLCQLQDIFLRGWNLTTFLLKIVHKSIYCIDNCAVIYASRRNTDWYISSKRTVPDVCMETTGVPDVLNMALG